MVKNRLFSSYLSSLFLLCLFGTSFFDVSNNEKEVAFANADISASDTSRTIVPKQDNNPLNPDPTSPFYLKKPSNQKTEIVYDPVTNTYVFQNKIGDLNDGPAGQMSLEDYRNYDIEKAMKDYWRDRSSMSTGGQTSKGLIPQIRVPSEVFENIFGSSLVEIRSSGSVELLFMVKHHSTNNPNIIERNRKQTFFDFDANIQMNLKAKIGDKIGFDLNYNTLAQFNFENKFKLRYEGKEDEIFQLLEFGNVTMPLSSRLIQGSQTLFGAKAQMQFGKLMVTAVVSQQEGNRKTITIQNGSELNEFEFRADEYEEDKHFFLAQYFYDNYNSALSTLPLVNSKINITRIEVWRTNIGSAINENRNVVAVTDLGEPNPHHRGINRATNRNYPDSNANDFLRGIDYSAMRNVNSAFSFLSTYRGGMSPGIDFEKVESARLLDHSEYTFNGKLGFISLTNKLNPGQVLAVAFQYTVLGDPNVYQVGQFSNEVETPNCLVVKLIRSTTLNTQIPMWKLMMKNVYSLNIYQFSPEEFRLNVLYNDGVAMGFFPDAADDLKNIPLIRLLGADRLNQQMAAIPDGLFDYLDNAATEGGTVQGSTGKVYWPLVEPFGKDLRAALASDPAAADKYAFDSLYSLPKVLAQQHPNKNRFYLEGRYKSSMGSMISLGMGNLAQGSVIVTAGGITLQENADYTVDYNMGMLRITNPSYMQSGTPISISLESKNLFGQKKTMFGLNAEYSFSKNFVVGATILNLRERTPEGLTKIKFGNEPINNTIWGMNLAYQRNSRWITRMLNYLPFYKSTTESRIQLSGEFAHFIPGHSRIIGKGDKAELYIDDFEAAISTYYLGSMGMWKMASIPQHQTQRDMFPEGAPNMELKSGYNRAMLSWYNIDPILHNKQDAQRIFNGFITADMRSEMYARRVNINEIFPNRPVLVNNGEDPYLTPLDLAFYPNQRGSYNFDALGSPGISAGLESDGTLKNPASRWAGIMRKMDNPDFESSNIEYIQFWLLDPFLDNPTSQGGQFYINLGQVSEDILRDGRKSFENGFPADGSDEGTEYTVWGRVPIHQPIVVAFDNDRSRKYQDIGLDGLYDSLERIHHADYLNTVQSIVTPSVYQTFFDDPSADNYHFYRGADYDAQNLGIVERYKKYCNMEGNSVTDNDRSPDAKAKNYIEQATSRPDIEDINNDNTMSEDEQYYQYEMDIRPDKLMIGKNYITDMQEVEVRLENGTSRQVRWYQFKVPVRSPDKTVGGIAGFSSIRFMRMFLKGFSDSVVFRFAELSLVRGDWRQYTNDLREDGSYPTGNGGETSFYVSTLSIQENARRSPIPYAVPAPVRREYSFLMQTERELNEQSLTMRTINLADGDARAVYKNTMYDFRRFGAVRFYLHGEKVREEDALEKGDVTFFIRMGTDFTENYYEYETEFDLTAWGTTDSALIWPQSNYVTIDLQRMIDVKQQRNIINRKPNSTHFPAGERYSDTVSDPITKKVNMVHIMGNPSLDNVKIIMMGIRNPKKRSLSDNDDMLPKSVEVWVNELRLGNFEEKGGWAALGNVRIDLADLGDVSFSAGISTPGFGALESSTYDRQMYTQTTLDFATNIQMGKMLPPKWDINLPVHYDMSRKVESPEYNPLNADVRLKEDLKTYPDLNDRAEVKQQAVDFIQRQNVNVLNARKNKSPKAKNWVWNISNFDFSYAYTEMKSYSIDMEYNNLYTHRGGIGYVYSCSPKNIKPFKKIEKMKSKAGKQWLQLLSDFNFHLYPRSYSFRTEVFRSFGESMLRNISKGTIIMEPYYAKAFEWTRDYSFAWDLSTSLKVDYTASAMAFITEPQGKIDTKIKRDSIWQSFGELGRMNNFQQSFNASYQIPINKIPIFSFITSNVRYQSTYMWVAAPPANDYIGNDISNSNTRQFNATANFVNLYNKSKYLKKVNQGTFGSSLKDQPILKKNQSEKTDFSKLNLTRQQQDSVRKAEKEKDEARKNYGKEVLDNFLRLTILLKNISFAYTEGRGTSLPGYMLRPDLLGLTFNKSAAPGFLFAFGVQNENLRHIASQNGWLTQSDYLNTPYMQQMNTNLSVKVALEPLKSFKIDLTATRTRSHNDILYYTPDSNGIYRDHLRQQSGSFSITTICAGTLFAKDVKAGENYINPNFENFKRYRTIIANRLAAERAAKQSHYVRGSDLFPDGYGRLSPEVLQYAFMAAYSGKNPDNSNISSPIIKIPLPNWRVTYNGLTKIPGMEKWFQSINIQHGYTCMYQLGGYGTNVLFNPEQGSLQDLRDGLNNFIPALEAGAVAFTESMNPIIGFDMTMKNSLQFKAEWRKTRNVTLSMASFQVSEMLNEELVFGAGYRFKDLKITFDFAGIQQQTDGDLTLRVDFSIRDHKTLLRKIEEDINQASGGNRILSIAVSGEYQITKNFSGKVFYNHNLNKPMLSNQFQNLSIDAGISLKIMLDQM